jgi:hypothetical protein
MTRCASWQAYRSRQRTFKQSEASDHADAGSYSRTKETEKAERLDDMVSGRTPDIARSRGFQTKDD